MYLIIEIGIFWILAAVGYLAMCVFITNILFGINRTGSLADELAAETERERNKKQLKLKGEHYENKIS